MHFVTFNNLSSIPIPAWNWDNNLYVWKRMSVCLFAMHLTILFSLSMWISGLFHKKIIDVTEKHRLSQRDKQIRSVSHDTTEILLVFISNEVIWKVEFCKCLWSDWVVMCDISERVAVNLLCLVLVLQQSVEHLQVQLSYMKGQVV